MKRRAFLAAAAALTLAACERKHRTYRLGERVRDAPPEGFAPAARTITWDELLTGNIRAADSEVRIVGFAVPLEFRKAGKVSEFLLVPYFGACIHVPPPPPNQVISVVAAEPAELRSMSAVWIAGKLNAEASDGQVARSGYRMAGARIVAHSSRKDS